jgi:hypothetical protein
MSLFLFTGATTLYVGLGLLSPVPNPQPGGLGPTLLLDPTV